MIASACLARIAAAVLAGAGLSGCVAAAALPVLAGGSILRSEAVSGAGAVMPAKPSASAEDGLSRVATADAGYVVTGLAELPAPSSADIASSHAERSAARSFDQFYGYALSQASLDPLDAPMRSALLESPGSLQPVRQHCRTGRPLVLVDLDPGDEVFDPVASVTANAALVEVLAVLRARGLAVGWVSDLQAEQADAVREALRNASLDTLGEDLLLLADGTTTKQERRQALAQTACPVAIAGDRRSDFDELYAYLRNPEAALALNEMFGAGWFLTPNPID